MIRRTLYLLLPLLLAVHSVRGQTTVAGMQVAAHGFVDSYHAVRSERPNDWMSSRTRLRTEFSLTHGGAGAFISANVMYNAILPDRSGFQLREAYLTYATTRWDLRAGQQIITWGVADGLRLTDVISPMDYTEFLAEDYDDIRVPVGALRVRYGGDRVSLDAVIVPVPRMYVLPTDAANPWSLGTLPDVARPSRRLYHTEYGARLTAYLSGIDFSLSALHTWQKVPELHHGALCYRRMGMFGADVSVPVGQVVLRGEVASYVYDAGSEHALIGLDWYIPSSWTLSAQYAHQLLHHGQSRHSGLATFRLSKAMLNNILQLQTFAYVDVTYGGLYDRSSLDYAVNDQVHLLLGYDLLRGDRGQFAVYRHNSEAWIKAKYSF